LVLVFAFCPLNSWPGWQLCLWCTTGPSCPMICRRRTHQQWGRRACLETWKLGPKQGFPKIILKEEGIPAAGGGGQRGLEVVRATLPLDREDGEGPEEHVMGGTLGAPRQQPHCQPSSNCRCLCQHGFRHHAPAATAAAAQTATLRPQPPPLPPSPSLPPPCPTAGPPILSPQTAPSPEREFERDDMHVTRF